MPSRHEIKCINKVDRNNPHERLSHIGGVNPDGTLWKLKTEDAIQGIKTGKWSFYVQGRGKIAEAFVAISPWGNECLKTTPDWTTADNLLSLMECRP